MGVTLLDSENIINFCLGRASLVSLVSTCQRAQMQVPYQLLQFPQDLPSCSESPTVLLHIVNDHCDSIVLCRCHQRSRSHHPSTAKVVGLCRMDRMGLVAQNQSQNAVGLIVEALTWKSVRDAL